MPTIALIAVALLAAWRPAETSAGTPVAVALAVLLLVPWAHRRTPGDRLRRAALVAAAVGIALVLSAVGGVDRARAVEELALAAAVVALAWVASREQVPERRIRLLALGIALLALWAAWQVLAGFGRAEAYVEALPEALQANAVERIESGRAFASLLLPGHLAVLLATALPILVAGVRRSWRTAGWLAGAVLCGVGLVLTRSPIGVGLAALALALLAVRRRRALLIGGVVLLTVALGAVAASRGDVGELDPVRLRVDNWRTAVWAWHASPLTGVGVGSYGQVTRAVPFGVGNLPVHAHSLPLEWLAEAGVAGAAAAAAAALWLVGLLRRLWPRSPELAVSLAVVPLHNLVDFSLYTSGIALPWAVLLGWGVATARGEDWHGPGGRRRELLVGAAAVAVALTLLHATSALVEAGARATDAADQRLDGAVRAQRLAPWRATPSLLVAEAALETNGPDHLEAAERALERARWWRPGSAALATAAGEVALADRRVPTGAARVWAAQRVQPRSQARHQAWIDLVDRLEGSGDAAER